MLNQQARQQVLITRIDNLEGIVASNLAMANRYQERGETEQATAYLENNERIRKIIAECREELAQIPAQVAQVEQP